MITTTTNSVEGKAVVAYKGIVFGEVITGIHAFKTWRRGCEISLAAAQSYENELMGAREEALAEMAERAKALGADAIIGVKWTMKY